MLKIILIIILSITHTFARSGFGYTIGFSSGGEFTLPKEVGIRDEVDWIEQRFATRVENVNPFHVLTYSGTITLTPSSDTWNRTIKLDDLVIDNLVIENINVNKTIRKGSIEDPSSRQRQRLRDEGYVRKGRTWRKSRTYSIQGEVELIGTTVDENVLVDSGDDAPTFDKTSFGERGSYEDFKV